MPFQPSLCWPCLCDYESWTLTSILESRVYRAGGQQSKPELLGHGCNCRDGRIMSSLLQRMHSATRTEVNRRTSKPEEPTRTYQSHQSEEYTNSNLTKCFIIDIKKLWSPANLARSTMICLLLSELLRQCPSHHFDKAAEEPATLTIL